MTTQVGVSAGDEKGAGLVRAFLRFMVDPQRDGEAQAQMEASRSAGGVSGLHIQH